MAASDGYCGNVLRVDLTEGKIWVEHPDSFFYRANFGGWTLGLYYLLRETALGPTRSAQKTS